MLFAIIEFWIVIWQTPTCFYRILCATFKNASFLAVVGKAVRFKLQDIFPCGIPKRFIMGKTFFPFKGHALYRICAINKYTSYPMVIENDIMTNIKKLDFTICLNTYFMNYILPCPLLCIYRNKCLLSNPNRHALSNYIGKRIWIMNQHL